MNKIKKYRQIRLQLITQLLIAFCGAVSTVVLLFTEWALFQGWLLRICNLGVISVFFYTFVYKSLIKAKHTWRQMENLEGKIDEV